MQMKTFSAVCPLEIGDTVAVKIRVGEKVVATEPKEALYIPKETVVVIEGPATLQIVTDIATVYYTRSGEAQFIYELNNSGKYEPLAVTIPVAEVGCMRTAHEVKR